MKHCLFSVILAATALSAQAETPIQSWSTPNGAHVLFVENHTLPMLDLQVDFVAGTAYDPLKQQGVAAMTHALLDAGVGRGKTALDENAIADRFADVGAQLNGSVDTDRASLTLRVLSHEEERNTALATLRQIISQPQFPAATLERELARALAGLRESQTQPAAILSKNFVQLVYGQHPYGKSEEESDLKKLTRAMLVDFHHNFYTAQSAHITLVGDLSRAQAEAIARDLIADLPAGSKPPSLPDATLPAARVLHLPHPASQAHIAIGMPGIKRGDPDTMALIVGNYTLGGGGFNSRLMKEVRDARGLSYGVYSYFAPQTSQGVFMISLQTKAEQTEQAAQVVTATLDQFLKDGPSEEELQAAKANLIKGFSLRVDNNHKILEQAASLGFYGLPLDSLDTYIARVQAVSLDQIRAAFVRHVQTEHLITVIVGGK